MCKNSSLLLLFTVLFMNGPAAQQGLKAEYYDGKNFEKKVSTRIDSKIDFSWLEIPPVPGINPNVCSIRWTGRLLSPETGTFAFSARVDDGIRVWVGNVLVIDAWDLHDVGLFSGKVKLEKGKQYDLKVEYFNALIEGEIRLLWQLPSERKPKVIENKYFLQTPEKPVQKTPVKPAVKEKKATSAPKPKQPAKAPVHPQKPSVVSADTLLKYIPENVFFEKSKSTILPESYADLDRLATFLVRNPNLEVTIEGHTDVIGDRIKNLALSQERADVVAGYLIKKGVGAERLTAKGYGSSRPLANNHSKEGNEENRRVEFVIH